MALPSAGDINARVAAHFRGKRVVITGGLGFVGSNLAERLLSYGAEVLLVDSLIPEYGGNLFNIESFRDRATVNIADVRDTHGMRWLVRDRDYLFNLAGQTSHLDSMENPFTDLEINCRSQLSILEACRGLNPTIRIVFASTRQFYGSPVYLPVDEQHPLQPSDVNGINKMAGEWYHILYHRVYGIPTVALRMTNTYGPRMRVRDARQTFLGWWFHQVLTGQEILVYGDGTQRRDFNYIDDCVDAFVLAAVEDRAVGEVFNLGAAPPWSLRDVAELVVKLNGAGTFSLVPFPPGRKAIDIGDYYADYKKITETLGWKPRVSLEDGIARTLAYYRQSGPSHYWNAIP